MRYTGSQTDSTMSSTRPWGSVASQWVRIGRTKEGPATREAQPAVEPWSGRARWRRGFGMGSGAGAGFDGPGRVFTEAFDKRRRALEGGEYHEVNDGSLLVTMALHHVPAVESSE